MKLLICRTIIIYLCVLFAMRLMGKRQLGELQPEELVSTILISNLASISIESEEVPITSSLIPAVSHCGAGTAGLCAELPQPEILQLSIRQAQDGHLGRTDRPECSCGCCG